MGRTPANEQEIRIMRVERDRKERQLYHIYTGAEEPLLSVHEDIMIRYRLMKDATVAPKLLDEIVDQDGKHRAYAQAVRYLGAKPRTKQEIIRYLVRKEFADAAVEHAAERLAAERLLDDQEYARRFAAQRLRTQQKGSHWIKQELVQRGVAKGTAEQAISELDTEVEREAAMRLAVRKWPSFKGEMRIRKGKLMQFLLRRGYPGALCRAVVREVDAGRDGEESEGWLDN